MSYVLTNAHRDYIARNNYTLLINLQGEQAYFAIAPTSGFSDPVLGLRYRGLHWGGWDVIIETAVTLPLGTVNSFFANSAMD